MSDGVHLDSAHLIALRPLALAVPATDGVSGLPGGLVTRRHGHGQEMADIRAYVPGDDIRHLDAGTTARTGHLHVRTYHDERDRTTLLVADMRPSMIWGLRRALMSVAAAEALALIGWQAVAAGGRVGLVALVGTQPVFVRPRGRTRGMLDVVAGLVRAHAAALDAAEEDEPPLDGLLAAVARVAPTGAEVALASGFDVPGPGLDATLGDLGRRLRLRLIEIGDAAERHLPAGAYPIVWQGRRTLAGRRATASATDDGAMRDALHLSSDMPPAAMAARLGAGHDQRRT